MMRTRQRFYLSWTMMVVAAIIVISANTILESWGQRTSRFVLFILVSPSANSAIVFYHASHVVQYMCGPFYLCYNTA